MSNERLSIVGRVSLWVGMDSLRRTLEATFPTAQSETIVLSATLGEALNFRTPTAFLGCYANNEDDALQIDGTLKGSLNEAQIFAQQISECFAEQGFPHEIQVYESADEEPTTYAYPPLRIDGATDESGPNSGLGLVMFPCS